MAIVYIHRRKDIDDNFENVFYVGIGSSKVRASQNTGRNKYWHNIVKKVGYTIEITHNNLLKEDACTIEKYLISFYGRNDLGLGNLCNVSDGGESNSGVKKDKEWIEKHRITQIGKKASIQTLIKMSLSHFGENNHFYGKKHSEETKKIMSIKASKRPLNLDNLEKMRLVNTGRIMKEESKLKLSNSRKGMKFTEEHKEKLRISKLAYYKNKKEALN